MTDNSTGDQLLSLIYVSSGTGSLTKIEIEEILTKARNKNASKAISGMLLYKGGNFLQVLEGPEKAVTELLETIRRDVRHDGIIVLHKERIQQRRFQEWAMAFKDVNFADLKGTEGYSNFLETSFSAEAFRSRPEVAYRMLLQFKENMR